MSAAPLLERWRAADPRWADGLVAAVLLALAQAESWLSSETAGRRPEVAAAAVAICAALAWRRSRPLASLVTTMAGFAALALTGELPTVAFLLPAGLLSLYSSGPMPPPSGRSSGSRWRSPRSASAPPARRTRPSPTSPRPR